MISDVLRGEQCPRCGAGALAAESTRVAATTYHLLCEHLNWWRLDLWFVRCGLCRAIWPVVAQKQQVSEATALRALAP